jgi:hypothetical protein
VRLSKAHQTTPASGRYGSSVIFRKVTNGFRTDWGAKAYAAARSVIATGRLSGLSALAALQAALAAGPILRPG